MRLAGRVRQAVIAAYTTINCVQAEYGALDQTSLQRFAGFASLYDANRPSPPAVLGPLLASYANTVHPRVVDIGSGTGLSSRWAATWAGTVIGIEPNDEMRAVAESRPTAQIEYMRGRAQQTGLPTASADIVLVVQAMHWMDPKPTLAEAARILGPGGVLAVADADWPPVAGIAQAERAWATLHGRIRVFEARLARGETGDELRRPIATDDPALSEDDLVDPHRHRRMPGGLRSWSKSRHLERMASSGHFTFTREVALNESVDGGPERFVALMYSQGSYQGLIRAGLSPAEIGATEFQNLVEASFIDACAFSKLSFCWRIRIGITPVTSQSS